MKDEMEQTSLMDKYIKLRLGGATYRVRLMTLLLFAAAAIILIAAILILAFSGSCSKDKAAAAEVADPTAAAVTVTPEATAEPTATPEATSTDEPESTEPTATPETSESSFKTLKQGGTNDGETVKQVQTRLIALHYMPYPTEDGKVTTTYGPMCVKAVSKFQERNGLKQTGQCDKETYDKLMSKDAVAYTMKKDDKLDIVRTIQNVLIKKGYLSGKADGVCGDKTIEAVKAFQKANNLTADGQAGTKTLQLLLGY